LKYYKNPIDNAVFGYESDGSQDKIIPSNFVQMSDAEIAAHVSAQTPVPQVPALSPRQIRQALTRVGLRAQVEATVAAGSQDLKDWWEFATQFERNHPLVVAMGQQLGQTPQTLDDVWALGKTL